MHNYQTVDGKRFRARGAEDLIGQMAQDAHYETGKAEDYMAEIAKRIYETTGKSINCATPQQFVQDLIEAGFVTKLN